MSASKPATRSGNKHAGGSDAAQARAGVYFALADALAEPEPHLPRLLAKAVAAGATLAGSQACQTAHRRLRAQPIVPPGALRAAHRQVTSGVGGRPLALYESLHRQGRLAGEATAEVAAYYQALGVAPERGELPDHASVELAFLGELAIAEAAALAEGDRTLAARVRAAHRSFLHGHAAVWLPLVGDALSAIGAPFYAEVGALLRGYLAEELDRPRPGARRLAAHPLLSDPGACTLCGLCTGACPPGALRIAEDDATTSLVLERERCTGCQRCVRTCPEQLLGMAAVAETVESAPGRSPLWVLAASPRATCPQCGEPTVSQAELQAVWRRLQPDPDLQRRFSLCVACKSMN